MRKTHSWRQVGAAFGVTHGTARRIAAGWVPTTPKVRQALGLPPLLAVPACPTCGKPKTPGHRHPNPNAASLFDLPPAVLLWKLQNREVLQ